MLHEDIVEYSSAILTVLASTTTLVVSAAALAGCVLHIILGKGSFRVICITLATLALLLDSITYLVPQSKMDYLDNKSLCISMAAMQYYMEIFICIFSTAINLYYMIIARFKSVDAKICCYRDLDHFQQAYFIISGAVGVFLPLIIDLIMLYSQVVEGDDRMDIFNFSVNNRCWIFTTPTKKVTNLALKIVVMDSFCTVMFVLSLVCAIVYIWELEKQVQLRKISELNRMISLENCVVVESGDLPIAQEIRDDDKGKNLYRIAPAIGGLIMIIYEVAFLFQQDEMSASAQGFFDFLLVTMDAAYLCALFFLVLSHSLTPSMDGYKELIARGLGKQNTKTKKEKEGFYLV